MAGGLTRTALVVATALALVPAAPGAEERTVVDEMLAGADPCSSLRIVIGGSEVGLTQLNDVGLSDASLDLEGDKLTASFSGRLDCGTPPNSALAGNASVRVDTLARLSLADCSIDNLVVDLHDIGGSLGTALSVASRLVEERVAARASDALVDLCIDFRNRTVQ